MNRNAWLLVIIALVVGAGAGYFAPHAGAGPGERLSGVPGGSGMYQVRTGTGGKFTNSNVTTGTIIAKSTDSITVELGGQNASSTNGTVTGSKIVLYDSSTQVGEFTSGTTNDLKIGQNVTVNGTQNSDGSLTAQTIQIRPAAVGPRIGG
jgi:hypothetical protein